MKRRLDKANEFTVYRVRQEFSPAPVHLTGGVSAAGSSRSSNHPTAPFSYFAESLRHDFGFDRVSLSLKLILKPSYMRVFNFAFACDEFSVFFFYTGMFHRKAKVGRIIPYSAVKNTFLIFSEQSF